MCISDVVNLTNQKICITILKKSFCNQKIKVNYCRKKYLWFDEIRNQQTSYKENKISRLFIENELWKTKYERISRLILKKMQISKYKLCVTKFFQFTARKYEVSKECTYIR